MMKSSKALGVAAIVSIAVVFLFLTSAAAPAMSSSQANAFTSQANANLLPNPVLNSNITWSTFHSGWKPLEYSNGTKNLTLNAGLSTTYKNPISINPTDIEAFGSIQNEKVGGYYWNKTTEWTKYSAGASFGTGTLGKSTTIVMTMNGNSTAAKTMSYYLYIPITNYPSANPAFDYVTASYTLTGPKTIGVSGEVYASNSSSTGRIKGSTITPGQTYFYSQPLTSVLGAKFNTTTGKGYSSALLINPQMGLPATTGTWTLTITGLALTDYQISLGTNNTGQPVANNLNPKMTVFDPTNLAWTEIANGGYQVAVSQPLQNITTQQSEISGNPKYVEQVTYQGNYVMPSAPDLSYSSSVISERFNVNASQTTVLDINGQSLLSTISGKNGTITLMTVNPTQKSTLIQIVDYTSSQWESVSGPPGFFSVNGILYYFDEIVLGIIAVVGLAGGAAVARTRSLRRVK